MVSNAYQSANNFAPENWPLKPETVHPERLAPALKALRFHPAEMIEEDIRPFFPGLDGMTTEEQEKATQNPRMLGLRKTIADCTSIHAAATALIQNEPWDLMGVYYHAIDHFGHGFHPDDMRLHRIPREPAGPAAEHRQFGIFAAKGPGIRQGQRVFGTNLLDICPKMLDLFGLPVGEDMDGKVITGIYENPPASLAKIYAVSRRQSCTPLHASLGHTLFI